MSSPLNCGKADPKALGKDFWENRYTQQQTAWDIGYASPPLMEYMQQVANKNMSILIPGAGNAHEVEALLHMGFQNITVIDIARQPLEKLQLSLADDPRVTLIEDDFFQLKGQYDLILEQTFFCAINPSLRLNYVHTMYDLLTPNGKLVGVLFNTTFEEGPPFGGNIIEYKSLLRGFFTIQTMEICYNSIPPRQDSELFVILQKYQNK